MRRNLLIVEKRDAAGKLDFSDPQPLGEWIHGVTEDELAKWYYAQDGLGPDGPNVSMATIYEWMKTEKGWHVRPKSW